jgi:hypothetical protein
MPDPTPQQVAAFERFMWERFGIEPAVAPDGTRYYERWQIEEAYEREMARLTPRADA